MIEKILVLFEGKETVSQAAKTAETATKKVGASATQMSTSVLTANNRTSKSLTDLGSQLRYMSLVSGIAAAGTLSLAKSFIEASKSIQDAQLKLGVYALSSGESLDAVNVAAQRLFSTGLVPLTDASTALANLLATGLGLEKSTQLLDTFLNAIVVGKENINDTFGDALVKASLGVRIFQERQIDATGINTQLNLVFEEYRKTLGNVSTQLSNAEKYQAIFNYYMKEGVRYEGAAQLATMTLSGTLSQLSANYTILKATLGNALLPAFGTLVEILRYVANLITDFARKFPALTSILLVGGMAVTILTAALAGLGALIPLVTIGLAGLIGIGYLFTTAFATTVTVIAGVSLAIGSLIYIVLKATGQWDKWVNSMRNLTVKMKDLIKPMKQISQTTDENNKKLAKQLKDIEKNIALSTRDFKEGMAEWVRDHDNAVSKLKTQIADLEKKYKEATSNIRKDFSSTMSDLEIDHARKVEDIQQQLAEEVSKGIWADQTRIRSLQKELKRENEDYARAKDTNAATRDEDLAEEKNSYDTKLAELQKQLDEELLLEKKHSALVAEARTWPILDELEKRTRAYNERLMQYADELKEIQANAAAESNAIAEVTNDLLIQNASVKTLKSSYSALIDTMKQMPSTSGGTISSGVSLMSSTPSVASSVSTYQDSLNSLSNATLSNSSTLAQLMSNSSFQSAPSQSTTIGPSPVYGPAQPAVTKYPTMSLEPGMTGSFVTQLQRWLLSKGYSIPDGATGYYGNQTKSAVASLQSALGVSVGQYAGYYGAATLAKLQQKYPAGYKMGGTIPGSRDTAVPIIAHGGETVLPYGIDPITININNPTVRSEDDLRKLADMVKDVLTSDTKYRHLR